MYGVISYSVAQRVHEIGIRMALGAGQRNIFRMIVGKGLRLAIAGLAIGTVRRWGSRDCWGVFTQLLFGVQAGDPATFAAVSVLLTAVTILACSIPARRAIRVDPMVALRHE